MNGSVIGWSLAVLAVALGWARWGLPGVGLAVSGVVFWLLLQFSRALRVLRVAGQRPVGHIDSAVMLNAKLRRGQTLTQVIALTRSLGEPIGADGATAERWCWTDPGGAAVELALRDGRLEQWTLRRPAATPGALQDVAGAAAAVQAGAAPAPAPGVDADGDPSIVRSR
ncbi:MAG: hypothetical protein ABIX12_07390 [Rubrivivax sp.]